MASTPGVGIKFESHFAPFDQIVAAMSPFLEEANSDEKTQFTIEDTGAFSVTVNTDSGFKYAVDHQKISVIFNHRVRFRPVSGGPPVMEMLSKPMPYTELLAACSERVVRLSEYMSSIKRRTINRVGIVSTTIAAMDDFPPGVSNFFDHVGSPWDNEIIECNVNIFAKLNGNERESERCGHNLIVKEDKSELVTLVLDWQRKYEKQQPSDERSLKRYLTSATEGAISYFEDLAEGGRFGEPAKI